MRLSTFYVVIFKLHFIQSSQTALANQNEQRFDNICSAMTRSVHIAHFQTSMERLT